MGQGLGHWWWAQLPPRVKRARRAWAIQVFFAGGGAACGPLCKGADFLWVVGLNHLMAHANRKIESNPSPQPQVPAPEAN